MKNTIGHNRWEISRTESPGNHKPKLLDADLRSICSFIGKLVSTQLRVKIEQLRFTATLLNRCYRMMIWSKVC